MDWDVNLIDFWFGMFAYLLFLAGYFLWHYFDKKDD